MGDGESGEAPSKTLRRICSGKPREIERPRMGGPIRPSFALGLALLGWVERKLHPYFALWEGRIPAPSERRMKGEYESRIRLRLARGIFARGNPNRSRNLRCERVHMYDDDGTYVREPTRQSTTRRTVSGILARPLSPLSDCLIRRPGDDPPESLSKCLLLRLPANQSPRVALLRCRLCFI